MAQLRTERCRKREETRVDPMISAPRRSKLAVVRALGLLSLLAATAACSSDPSSTARVVYDKQVQVPFPPELVQAGVKGIQFRHFDWNAQTDEIAASAEQGPWVYIVNAKTGETKTLRSGVRGGGRKVAWIPGTTRLVAERTQSDGKVTELFARVYDTSKGPEDFQETPSSNVMDVVRGTVLPDGRKGFLVFGYPRKMPNEKGELVRVEHYAALYAEPDWKLVRTVRGYPKDDNDYQIERADAANTPRGLLVATQAYNTYRPTGVPATDGSGRMQRPDEIRVINLNTQKIECEIDIHDGDYTDWAHGDRRHALSLDGKWLAVVAVWNIDLYDMTTCRRKYQLSKGDVMHSTPPFGGQASLRFTHDSQYLITVGGDIRTKLGGYLNVWRVQDARHIYGEQVETPEALGVSPTDNRFIVGHQRGDISFFRIKD
ncbi:hypothetical protein RQP54_07615 [Curvibacter sp. APW13]|uniref:hypothetical protein n=1 Tax=Curvibacter sp. APW13 TaxID=3077236 RepID=UPI0028DD511C|nr:hypothetical protein [Curvibacter sp. APW13]MDT8990732.1 hypothetical protein [Curvibacter sp. APW13]